jgi:tetratricopeptide (TPR) repeat protein
MSRHADFDDRILPTAAVMAVVVLSVCASFLMVPSQGQLRERSVKDHMGGELRRLIDSGAFGPRDPAMAQLSKMDTQQLNVFNQLIRLTPRERLRLIFDPARGVDYDLFMHFFVMASVQYVDVVRPQEALQVIGPQVGKIPLEMRQPLMRLLAKNAMATEDMGTAVKLLHLACQDGAADWETVRSLVDAQRWSNRPDEARRDLQSWLIANPDLEAGLNGTARDLLFALALESGAPDEALADALADLRALPASEALPLPLLNQAFAAAKYAGKTAELMPWIKLYLTSFAEDALSWPDLLARQRAGSSPTADYMLWTQRAAQVADWNSMAEQGYHHQQRLLAMGQMGSLDRYLALGSYMGQGLDTAAMLTSLGAVPGRPELLLTLARLTASNGDAEVALEHYDEWLKAAPMDQAARWEHACLTESLGSAEVAIATFESLMRDFPTDARAGKRAVAVLNRNGLHRRALALLEGLPIDDFDPDTAEDYVLLAEAMDVLPSLERALRISIEMAETPLVADFIRLSEVRRSAVGSEAAIEVLREASQRLPEVSVFRSQMAAMLLQEGQFQAAVDEALHPTAWRDQDARFTALSACLHCGRAEEVVAALGTEVSTDSMAFNTVLDLAAAYWQLGNHTEARRLFDSVPVTPARMMRIAQARLLAGDYEGAEALARANIKQKRHPESADWVLLGDVHQRQGRVDEAQVCYSHAVQSLTARLRHRVPSANPSSTVPLTQSVR